MPDLYAPPTEPERACTLEDLEVSIRANAPVDENGEPQTQAIIDGYDIEETEPYFCENCCQYFDDWKSAKAHLGEQA